MSQTPNQKPTPSKIELVVDYLSKNPEFFGDQPDLLEQMKIPHPSGVAVSLISKQIELLRKKNGLLTHQLGDLVQIARRNDQLFEKLHRLTLTLFGSETLDEAIENLEKILYDDFLADFVALRLIGTQTFDYRPDLFVNSNNKGLAAFKKILETQKPFCGKIMPSQATFLFGTRAGSVKSSALIPISSQRVSGLLAVGSEDKKRFQPEMGHLFLENIKEITSLCLASFFEPNGKLR